MLSFKRHTTNYSKVFIPSLKASKVTIYMSKMRAFFFSFAKPKGSMALEGSMVFPVFLFFMMTVLLSLEAVRLQSNVREALYQAGSEKAFMGYLVKYCNGTDVDAAASVRAYMEEQSNPYLCVSGGAEGIKVQDSSCVETNGFVCLKVNYGLKPFISWIPIGEALFEDEFFSHAWTGFSGNEMVSKSEEQDIYVYITKTGSKYHFSPDCSYLRIPISAIDSSGIAGVRNSSGGKYYACEKCGSSEAGLVYITSDGSRYHSRADCSSLKRTVYMIPISKASGYTPCSKCGG